MFLVNNNYVVLVVHKVIIINTKQINFQKKLNVPIVLRILAIKKLVMVSQIALNVLFLEKICFVHHVIVIIINIKTNV